MKFKTSIFLFTLIFFSGKIFSDDTKEITSLKQKLALQQADTAKIGIMLEIAVAYRQTGEFETSKKYAEDAVKIAKDCGKLISQSYRMVGLAYREIGKKDSAMKYMRISMNEAHKIKNQKNLADVINDIGTTFFRFQKVDSALTYMLRAAKLREKIGDVKSQAISYSNISLMYSNLGNPAKAMDYSLRALEMFRKSNSTLQEAMVLNNIGNMYKTKNDLKESLKYYFNALEIMEKLQKKISIAQYKGNIGNVYSLMGDPQAKKYLEESARLMEATGDKKNIAETYHNLAQFYYKSKNYDKGLEWSVKSLKLAEEMMDLERKEQITLLISACYEEKGNHKKALDYYKEHDGLGDSLSAAGNKDVLNKLNIEYETEKKELQIKNLETEKAAEEAEIAKQRAQKLFLGSCLAGALLLGVLLFYGFIKIRKNKKLIEAQKQEVEHQKEIVEEKNKDITDSINYAKRIQHAILKSEEHSSPHLPPHFILFKPKDIVSGDFYWALEKQDHLYLAAADCTGHGVPGAFLTMLGISFLNEINAHEKLLSPAEILDKLRERVIKELGQTGKALENKDGMDISLGKLNLKTMQLEWAGANNPLYYIQDNELKEIKSDKQPIAYYMEMKPFTNHVIQFKKGDSFYLLTDGFADQFGGDKGKKFKYKQLQERLIETIKVEPEEQKRVLNNTFEEWRGSLEQVDDVCIIGVRPQ